MTTQERCDSPPRSPTIVGSAVDTIVWSSEASSSTSISAAKISRTRCCGREAVRLTRAPPSSGAASSPAAGIAARADTASPRPAAASSSGGSDLRQLPTPRAGRRAASADDGATRVGAASAVASITGANDHRSSVRSANREVRAELPLGRARAPGSARTPAHLSPRLGQPTLARRIAQEHLLQHAIAALELQHSLEERDQARPGIGLGQGGLGHRQELVHALGEHRLDQIGSRRKVAVERRDANTRSTGDHVQPHLDTLLCEHLSSRRKQ